MKKKVFFLFRLSVVLVQFEMCLREKTVPLQCMIQGSNRKQDFLITK
jgi:hypothetical protein